MRPFEDREAEDPSSGSPSHAGHDFGRIAVFADGAAATEPVQRRARPAPEGRFADPGRPDQGKPLPDPVRGKMEQFYGHDFSQVRVHQGSQAASLNAVAYTQGRDIHFSPGRYSPMSREGQKLLGHELAHVVQQDAGEVAIPQGKGAPINADPELEAQAETLGAKAAASRPVEESADSGSRTDAAQGE